MKIMKGTDKSFCVKTYSESCQYEELELKNHDKQYKPLLNIIYSIYP